MDGASFKKKIIENNLSDSFIFHDLFVEEFVASVTNSGEEKLIINQFIHRLNVIKLLDNLNCGLKWLEYLKSCGLYSLHIDTKSKNFRLLFSVEKTERYSYACLTRSRAKNKRLMQKILKLL